MTRYDHYTDKFINDDLISKEESLMCLTGEYLEGQEYKLDDEICKFIKRMQNIPSVPAIPIPEGATNGDIIKALFPCLEKYEYEEPYTHGIALAGNDNRVTWFANEWWNSPYKRGETE